VVSGAGGLVGVGVVVAVLDALVVLVLAVAVSDGGALGSVTAFL
jgi:hypothetical protein